MRKHGSSQQRTFWITALGLVGLAAAAMGAAVNIEVRDTTEQIFQWRPFLAPFHAVVLHFPIGFITMALILEFYSLKRPSQPVRDITRMTIWLSFVSGLITAAFGVLRAGDGGYEAHALSAHRIAGFAVPVVTLATLLVQHFSVRGSGNGLLYSYRALLVATVGLVAVAGHYGGNLTHGSHYLTENAPEFVRDLLEDEPVAPEPQAPVAGGQDALAKSFAEKLQPILEAKCVRCHGPEKQKGGYRLDKLEFALKAGESEKPGIVLGKPMESQAVKLILAKPGSDEIMPPDGKEPLTRDETMTIVEWIRDAASGPVAEVR